MQLDRVWLTDFRSYASAEIALAPGLTAVVGANGQGKSNLLEAIGWMGGLRSFRAAPTEALVRVGAERAIIRGEGSRAGRALLIECEVAPGGRSRMLVNRQPVRRVRDGLDFLRAVVFAPDDLELVKGGPGGRRRFLDGVLAAVHPRYDALRSEVDRVLKQRNALLRQSGGRLDESATLTLDVWDAKLVEQGERLAVARARLAERLAPAVAEAYAAVAVGAEARAVTGVAYSSVWLGRPGGLEVALAEGRRYDLRRGTTQIGPHRDELDLHLGGLAARTHASQGEQRSLALALRLASHRVVTEVTGSSPVLLLDDVFSELDARRADALLANLPDGQALLTTAAALPPGTAPEQVVRVVAVPGPDGGVVSSLVEA